MSQGQGITNMNYKLTFQFVPDGCWCSNLRTILTKRQWDFIRNDAKERSNYRCAICGAKVSRLEGHEVWDYDEVKGIQILKDVIAVCKDCHSAIHYSRTSLKGDVVRAEEQFMKVNNCSYVEMRKRLGEAVLEHKRRNEINEWSLDLTWLKRFIREE